MSEVPLYPPVGSRECFSSALRMREPYGELLIFSRQYYESFISVVKLGVQPPTNENRAKIQEMLGRSFTHHSLLSEFYRTETKTRTPPSRERGSRVPAGPSTVDDADTGTSGLRPSCSPNSQHQARIPSVAGALWRLHKRTGAVVCPSTTPPSRRTPPQDRHDNKKTCIASHRSSPHSPRSRHIMVLRTVA